jgi:hypothetical protein
MATDPRMGDITALVSCNPNLSAVKLRNFSILTTRKEQWKVELPSQNSRQSKIQNR